MSRDQVGEAIVVPSEDPKKKPEDEKAEKEKGGKLVNGDKKKDEAEELSEEDATLKGELEMLVERLKEPDRSLHRPALESLRTLIRTSTSSMTSVPKPLKFLRPFYPELQEVYESWPSPSNQQARKAGEGEPVVTDKGLFADILSVLAMTYSDTGKRETLAYRLKGGSEEDPGLWGNEYVRHLAGEISEEYNARRDTAADTSDLHELALRLVPFFLAHNGEPDAVDLLLELESISSIIPFVDANNYQRVCLYMVSCVSLLVPPDDKEFLKTAREIYRKNERVTESLVLSIRLHDPQAIKEDFESAKNPQLKQQLAYILSRQQVPFTSDEEAAEQEESILHITDENLLQILGRTQLSTYYKEFGKELSILEPRSLEDVYKSHMENSRSTAPANVDSAKQNLAGTFVNAFVNAGFGNDKLVADVEGGQSWIYKNKDHGMLSATASLGMSYQWDPENGLSQIDKYTYGDNNNIKAGALLAHGILYSGIWTEDDVALGLLRDAAEAESKESLEQRSAAILGLGLAYSGTRNSTVREVLLPHISEDNVHSQLAGLAALSLGLVFVGSCDGEIATTILSWFMEKDEEALKHKWSRYLALGLGLLYLGRQEDAEATVETLKAIEHPVAKQALILVDICAYAGTGNVLKVQQMLHHCSDHLNVEKDEAEEGAEGEGEQSNEADKDKDEKKEKMDDLYQMFAVWGIALIAMGEDIGSEMSLRQLNHLMSYGEPVIRKAVPLALGLISASNPVLSILDTLSKYSHDNDLDVAVNAIFAMGLVGAGTSNARLAQMLRALAGYYRGQADCLFMVRIAQGLVYMGKGAIGVNPFHTDRQLMSPTAVAGLLATMMSFTDSKALVLDKAHWLLYCLVPAMYPRFLFTLDEEGKTLPVSVRVGQAVDVVGVAGKPRSIAGFQTHTTPVRLATTERAELATEEFFSYSHILENVVILTKNKGFESEADGDNKMDVSS